MYNKFQKTNTNKFGSNKTNPAGLTPTMVEGLTTAIPIWELLKITEVLQMDRNIIEKALNSKFNDFEDALQNYSAVNNGNIDLILTRNLKDYKKSELGVFMPETYIKSLNANH
jgi:hypothetical protein